MWWFGCFFCVLFVAKSACSRRVGRGGGRGVTPVCAYPIYFLVLFGCNSGRLFFGGRYTGGGLCYGGHFYSLFVGEIGACIRGRVG